MDTKVTGNVKSVLLYSGGLGEELDGTQLNTGKLAEAIAKDSVGAKIATIAETEARKL